MYVCEVGEGRIRGIQIMAVMDEEFIQLEVCFIRLLAKTFGSEKFQSETFVEKTLKRNTAKPKFCTLTC